MIKRVSVRHYKSFADVSVDLGPLTVFVGPNGAGKSNFVDVLRFVSHSLWLGLDVQVPPRGGINALLCQTSGEAPSTIHFSFEFQLTEGEGVFTFDLTKETRERYRVEREEFAIAGESFERVGTSSPMDSRLEFDPSSLALSSIGTREPFSRIRRHLTGVRCYQIYPSTLRTPQEFVGGLLMENGSNFASVISGKPDVIHTIRENLSIIVPYMGGIEITQRAGLFSVRLHHRFEGGKEVAFDLSQEADGTLRLLGLLTALYQQPSPTLIAIEEPELFVHPGALFALYEMIKEVSQRTQVILTTHSPDLISYVDPEELRIVENVSGVTKIGLLEERQIGIIQDKLFSTGELLHVEGLQRRSSDQDTIA